MNWLLEKLTRTISIHLIEPYKRIVSGKPGFSFTLIIIFISTALVFIKNRESIMDHINGVTRNINQNGTFRRWMPRSNQMDPTVLKRGGYVAGLVNDGNTCFMNSVIQSLASSKELARFLEDIIETKERMDDEHEEKNDLNYASSEPSISNTTDDYVSEKKRKSKIYGRHKRCLNKGSKLSGDEEVAMTDLTFSISLKEMLDKLNAKYYNEKPYFKTNKLLKTMSKSPNKNMLLGYDQEDAQEFFQNILAELEKNVKSLHKDDPERKPVAGSDLPKDALVGQAHLDKVGMVYIPTEQIDPNIIVEKNEENYYTPFKLITPLDGISAERIGCLQCGENGGIRYSVSSGLSLNLPSDDMGSAIRLTDLLYEWIKPEIIDGVECNRCALHAVLEHLVNQVKQYKSRGTDVIPEKLLKAFEKRIEELEGILAKPVIDDEDYKKLHTENMVRKSSKSKQILISRPPPLLAIHINRSVFDPRTYMIRKNNARVIFKSRLNLSPWCCDINEINLDARLPMSKKEPLIEESSEDEKPEQEYYAMLHQKYEKEFEDSDEDENEDDNRVQNGDSYINRDVSNYDPLNREIDSSSSFSEVNDSDEEYIEETDALGNTIRKKAVQVEYVENTENGDSHSVDKEVQKYKNGSFSSSSDEETDEAEAEEEHMIPPVSSNSSVPLSVPSGPLTYVLRSVIVHYGTHNYGHYIAFRKSRGCWWRISDETVYIVDEAEVLSTPGVFMLFYEYDYDGISGKMRDDIEAEEKMAGNEVEISQDFEDQNDEITTEE